MADRAGHPWHGLRAALATMHGKERVIAPLFKRFLAVTVTVPAGSDTDSFGTFTREIARQGSMLDAARAKARLALVLDPAARLGIASEGSFGPDPQLFFVPAGQELVVVIDRESDLELIGYHCDRRTNFAATSVNSVDDALAFAQRVRFPSHGLIVMGSVDGQPDPTAALVKGLQDPAALAAAVTTALARHGTAHVETDMRAHHNPTRMRAIRRAALDVVRRYGSKCPHCRRPGFAIAGRTAGLPCADCGAPTAQTRSQLWRCSGCLHQEEVLTDTVAAEPRYCDWCNP